MKVKWNFYKSIVLSIAAITLAAAVMIFPKAAFAASLDGLEMWWEVVFPSLLPFFILSEILIGFGVVHFFGVLFEPLMRPLFKVPGSGGFVWAMGLSSGFPAGAKLTARLWQQKEITTIEAERLVSFTNCSNPLFIFGAVAVGFFNNPSLGIVLALSHYAGNILVGLTMRFHGKKMMKGEDSNRFLTRFKPLSALQKMHQARLADGRPIGKLLGDAVQSSTSTLLMIGGFIILFSVINKVLSLLAITPVFAHLLEKCLSILSISGVLSYPLITGLFEITLGSKLASESTSMLLQQCIIVSFILAFSGFSVQAQVASIIADTDIRFKPFFFARLLHGLYASVLAALFFPLFLYSHSKTSITVWAQNQLMVYPWDEYWHFFIKAGSYMTLAALILSILIWGLKHSLNKKNPRFH
ncbi:sporulation integral membrane protein YlbJ [Fictibacillus sp. FJAT-27399]|uniref:sporulation integral membrane protein YlbJ n=1 Tax=Fictibacillus sp. FJAT-27399 TaxID=1729689 RepID=UPI000782FF43|nr:sporulation integral membrane protein YlbJ [Fictibacillus sp. FJAT-27399]